MSQIENSITNSNKYIDLHLHLDGAITLEMAKQLSELQNIKLPADNDLELERLIRVPDTCSSLNDFLKCFDLPLSLMQTKKGITEAVYLVSENIRTQGVIYAEIRFAPQLHTSQGLTQEEVVLAAIEGMKKTSLKVNFILCCMRGKGNEADNYETLEIARKYLTEDGGVVAIDLAGAEGLYPTSDYRKLFERAREYQVPFTIHAGEADGAESIKDAISFGAKRIGHGVHAVEDEEVLRLLKEKEIFLEMCPTSNRQTHAVEDMSKYPFMDFLRMGIKVTINTDDMTIEGTTCEKEYYLMEKEYGMSSKQRREVLNNSIEAAFTTAEVKEKLRREIDKNNLVI